MKDFKQLLFTSIVSFIVAMLTGWFTSKLAFKSEVKKYLYSKREMLYLELYEHLDKFLMHEFLVYDDNYKEVLYSFKPKVKLVSSKGVIDGYKELINVYNQNIA